MLSRLSQYVRILGFGLGVKRPMVVCAAVCVCAALGLLGCKGATLPATNISSTGAKLNLHGEADNGTAFSYFEYWQTAVPSLKSTTTVRNWPAGAQGDFGDRANGLRQATSYSYRVCGNDSGKPATCVNTRSFTTGVSGYSGIAHPCGNWSSICVGDGSAVGAWKPAAISELVAGRHQGRIRELRQAPDLERGQRRRQPCSARHRKTSAAIRTGLPMAPRSRSTTG